jgi:hypothetical protein
MKPVAAALWLIAFACLLPVGVDAAETRSFVLSYFYPANYYGDDTCPQGLNPLPDVFFKRDLRILGLPQAEVNSMFEKDYKIQNGDPTTRWVAVVATRGNGRDNVYLHPTTVPDAHLKPAVGRFAYGFNLDGRGAASPDSYEDPETHEHGINNQLFRAIGCIQAYKGYPPPQPPLEAEYRWDNSRPVMGAWLISVSGADLGRDGDVTVRFETAVDPVVVQDATAHVQSDMTYRVADHPLSVNVLKGTIRNGVIYTEPARIGMRCNSYIQPLYDFLDARMRLRIKPDGRLEGVLGGYQPWYDLYWSHAKVGYVDERGFGVDAPALFYALRRYADAYPDPHTHQNTAISTAYMIEAVPAFIAPEVDPGAARRPAVNADTEDQRAAPWLCRTLGVCQGSPGFLAGMLAKSEPPVTAAPPLARRLTADQYRRVIADVFGPTIRVGGRFEPGLRDQGLLALGTARVGVTATGMEQYDALAHGIARQVTGKEHRATLVPCAPANDTAPDDACAARFFTRVGTYLYRRPLSQQELHAEVAAAHAASATLKSFYDGLGITLAGMLESPEFLFRTELAAADPEHPGSYRLEAYSKASQLSFFLWNSAPDGELMTAAADGSLDTRSGLDHEVARMLASPRLESGMRAFFADMLQFDLFDTLAKDATIYPKWTFKVSQDAQEQTLRTIVDLLLTRHGDYRDLFTTRSTFLTPTLASIYRVPLAQNLAPWQPYEFPAGDPRAGILAQASFVALHSHEGSSSPTLRGKALRELLLCEPVPAPPGNVNLTGAQDHHDPHYRTMRERLTAHRSEPTCAGCHKLMDPIGLALENFDSDGEYRTSENGQALDTSGELDGIAFSDAAGLGRAMHDNPATGACLVRRLYSYATGRAPSRHDMPWIRYLEKSFIADGYRVPDLMRRIAISENLYRVTAPATQLVASADPASESAR